MKRICIIGSGAAGLLLLLNFQKHGIDPARITIIDPTHMGGDLAKKWYSVRSNTTWRQIIEVIPSKEEPWSSLSLDEPVELKVIIDYLRESTKTYMAKTNMRTDFVSSVMQENNTWKIFLQHGKNPILADVVFFTQGSEPKSLDLPFPSLPLEIALNKTLLQQYIKPNQHVLLFGTAHSGSLIVKNLVDCGAIVTNFYATEKPFYFARDGEYDGVKQDAATIADNIISGAYPTVTLESVHDTSAIIRASRSADVCIYACGFEPRVINQEWKRYDGLTGRIEGTTTAWGFGIAYPNKAQDGDKPKVYWDVSVPAFQAHIEKQMPTILATLQSA